MSLLAIELVVMVLLVFYLMTEMDLQSQLVVMAFEVNLELIPFRYLLLIIYAVVGLHPNHPE